jgi:hypothetical protein
MELVRCLQVLLRSRRLRVADLPERTALLREMRAFRVKITAAHEPFEAGRRQDHDDLVLAVALAAWWGEQKAGSPAV